MYPYRKLKNFQLDFFLAQLIILVLKMLMNIYKETDLLSP